jgi:peptidoglycan/LPS O-acetylase OafA/YrhL
LLRSKTIHEFLTLRVLRLIPALAFEVAISALILGPLLTVFIWRDYFSSHLFRAYWLNIVGDIHFQLPGLFLNNPDPNLVNGQLWTIPVELKCYLAITAMFLIGIARARWRMAALLALCIAAFPLAEMIQGKDPFNPFGVSLSTKIMIESFLVGVAIYLFRDRLPLSRGLGLTSAVLAFLCLGNNYAAYVACLPIGYLTVWLGLSNTPRTIISRIGDYSYGIYIYGYTIQQAYSYLFPNFRIWWANFVISLTVTFVCAAVSWHLVEKPVLEHRRDAVAVVGKAVTFVASQLSFRLRRSSSRGGNTL